MEGGVDGVSVLGVEIDVNAEVSVPNARVFVAIPHCGLNADLLVFKLNVESS